MIVLVFEMGGSGNPGLTGTCQKNCLNTTTPKIIVLHDNEALDPHGSGTYAWIRNSENYELDPDPELIIPDPQHCKKGTKKIWTDRMTKDHLNHMRTAASRTWCAHWLLPGGRRWGILRVGTQQRRGGCRASSGCWAAPGPGYSGGTPQYPPAGRSALQHITRQPIQKIPQNKCS